MTLRSSEVSQQPLCSRITDWRGLYGHTHAHLMSTHTIMYL
jgi:hypothetical protein